MDPEGQTPAIANVIREYGDNLGAVLFRNPDGTPTQVRCSDCGEVRYWRDMVGDFTCESCDREHNRCSDCESISCECDSSDEYIRINERLYSAENLLAFQSLQEGKVITSKRIFSAELECYAPSQSSQKAAEAELHEHVGVSSDGSLGTNGVEFQTPKLKGKKGEQAIKDICKVLNDNDFRVDKSTGLHIHLDGKGLLPRTLTSTEPTALKQLWQFYIAFDDVILSFLPGTRRMNRYCKQMKHTADYDKVANCNSQRDIESLWYKVSKDRPSTLDANKGHHYHDSRYNGVNLHSLLGSKHLEVRFHSGTLNATKILEWTALHQRIADLAAANNLVTSEHMLALTLAQKTKMFFAILKLTPRAQKYFERRQEQFKIPSSASAGVTAAIGQSQQESDLQAIELTA